MSKEVFITPIAVFHYKNSQTTQSQTTPKPSREQSRTNQKWLPWGDDDMWPQTLWNKVEKSNVASTALTIHRDAHFGNGLIYYKTEYPGDGKKRKNPIFLKEVDQFLKKNRLQTQYLDTLVRDYEIYNLSAVEIVFESKVSMKVSGMYVHDAQNFRFGVHNKKGVIDKGYLSANFPQPADDELEELPLIDPFNPEQSIRQANSFRFIYPVISLSPGKFYYPKSNWYSVISSGWLDISLSIPAMKKALFANAMTIKYLVEINEDYWANIYKDWTKMTDKEKLDAKKKLQKEISDYLAGIDNQGKALSTPFYYDKRANKEVPSIKITLLKDETNNEKYLPDASAANDEILFGFQIDPGIIGVSPGKTATSDGSGSNKRIIWNILQSRKAVVRKKTVDPLEIVSQLNGWDIDWGYEDTIFQTLDENPTGKQSATN